MGFPIDLPSGKEMTINYMLCIIALSCFFFWRKCSTVVAVGVQTSFLLFCKKCDRKKQQLGGLCGSRQKDRASPEVRGAGIFDGWGLPSAELPVIILQAKPDRFNRPLC